MAMEIDQKAPASLKRCRSWDSCDEDGDTEMIPVSTKRVRITEKLENTTLHAHFDASSKQWQHCTVANTEAGAIMVPNCHASYLEALKIDLCISSLVVHTTAVGAVGFILGPLSNRIRSLVTTLVLDMEHSSELRRLSIAAFKCENLQNVVLVPHGNAQLAHHVTKDGLGAILLDGCAFLPRHLRRMSHEDCAAVYRQRSLLNTNPKWQEADDQLMRAWYSSYADK